MKLTEKQLEQVVEGIKAARAYEKKRWMGGKPDIHSYWLSIGRAEGLTRALILLGVEENVSGDI